MKKKENFNFKKARKVSPQETESFRKAIENTLGVTRSKRGRPQKEKSEKFTPVSIRLHPDVLEWAKCEAKKRGIGYQTVINEILLKAAS